MVMDVLATAIEEGRLTSGGTPGRVPSAALVAAATELGARARQEGFLGAGLTLGVSGVRIEFIGPNHAQRASSENFIDDPTLVVDVRGGQ